MSKPFDAATKQLIARNPAAWLRVLGALPSGVPENQVVLVNVDISAVTASVDCLLQAGNNPRIAFRHLEFESNPKEWIP